MTADEQFQPDRSRRRAVKVDYSEKKEDFYFEPQPKQQPSPRKRRKTSTTPAANTNKNNTTAISRSESPLSTLEDSLSGDNIIPLNFQPEIKNWRFSHILKLDGAVVKNRLELHLKDGTVIRKDDSVYMVCEPPGEPYYVGRIMGFTSKKEKQHHGSKSTKGTIEPAEDCMFKVNWWYRARDISKSTSESRLLFASMHSDTCPIQSFRGTCTVKHRDEIDDLESYKNEPNHFWFEKFFDRYMIKFYDVLPTELLTSLPENYRKALHKRYQYVFLEQGKVKEMMSQPKSCSKCHQWAGVSDSIECCECREIIHMLCLDPPMVKKPARGFAWSCIKCIKKLEARKMIPLNIKNETTSTATAPEVTSSTTTTDIDIESQEQPLPYYEEQAIQFLSKDAHNSFEDRRDLEEWCYRYLGMHAKLEDALDVQDRPYPRAASRLGPKNQLTGVQLDWFDHAVQYYDISELQEDFRKSTATLWAPGRRRKTDGRRRKNKDDDTEAAVVPLKLPKEFEGVDPVNFPRWLQPRPKGYIERGGDDTVELLWKEPESFDGDINPFEVGKKVDAYVKSCDHIAARIGLLPTTPNFQDMILKNLLYCNYDIKLAMELNEKIDKTVLKEPQLTTAEIKKFENGIKKYGSELYPTFKEVKTQPFGMIVRFYYLWKKSPQGRLIWGNYPERKKNKTSSSNTENRLDAGITNDVDDSSYDVSKPHENVELQCKHCHTDTSKQWFRSPGVSHPEGQEKTVQYALCLRCARIWRRYAVVWEDPIEVLKKTSQKGIWKKKVERELAIDSELILKARKDATGSTADVSRASSKKQQSPTSSAPLAASSNPSVSTLTTVPSTNGNSNSVKKEQSNKSISAQPIPSSETSPEKKPSRKSTKAKEEQATAKPQIHSTVPASTPEPDLLVPSILNDNAVQSNKNTQLAIAERYYQITSPYYNVRPKFKEPPSAILHSSSGAPSKPRHFPQPCSLCQGRGNVLTCTSCQVSVHPECYGVDTDPNMLLNNWSWHCDTCSNTLNPVISEDYECVLCRASGGAMKRTIGDEWVHILCAFLYPDAKFEDTQSLQPVFGCKGTRKDVLRCCECRQSWHFQQLVSNGAAHVTVGFKFHEMEGRDVKTIKIGHRVGHLQAALMCSSHVNGNNYLHQVNAQGKRHKQTGSSTLLSLFLDDFKRADRTFGHGCSMRAALLKQEGSKPESSSVVKSDNSGHKCLKCHSTSSLYWIQNTCYSCHNSDKYSSPEKQKPPFINEELDCSHYGIPDISAHIAKPPGGDQKYFFGDTYDVMNDLSAFETWKLELDPYTNGMMRVRTTTEVVNTGEQPPMENGKQKMSIGNILG